MGHSVKLEIEHRLPVKIPVQKAVVYEIKFLDLENMRCDMPVKRQL